MWTFKRKNVGKKEKKHVGLILTLKKHVGKSGRFQEIGRQGFSPVDQPKRRPVQRFPAVSTCCSTSSLSGCAGDCNLCFLFYKKKRPTCKHSFRASEEKKWKIEKKKINKSPGNWSVLFRMPTWTPLVTKSFTRFPWYLVHSKLKTFTASNGYVTPEVDTLREIPNQAVFVGGLVKTKLFN